MNLFSIVPLVHSVVDKVPPANPTASIPRKLKVKFILEQAMKAQRRSRGIALLFL
jgi:hypothetical protein